MKKILVFLFAGALLISCGSMKDADATTNAELNEWIADRKITGCENQVAYEQPANSRLPKLAR